MQLILAVPYFVWLILSALCFACGEFLSKKWALAPSSQLVALILIAYTLGVIAWLPAIYEKNQLSIVGVIWSVLSLAMTVLIGVFIFSEKLSLVGIVGIIFAFASVVLLSMA